jgi:hypothetical protein
MFDQCVKWMQEEEEEEKEEEVKFLDPLYVVQNPLQHIWV